MVYICKEKLKYIIMNLPKLNPEEQKQFENGVIKVDGTAMSRTALGIIAAFFRLFPKATYEELKEAFPDNLIPTGGRAPKTIFKPFTERDFGIVHSLDDIKNDFSKANLPYDGVFFLEKDEMFKTSDGVTVIVKKSWAKKNIETGKNELEIFANRALQYGIFVDKFEFTKAFGKGSYTIEVLNTDLFKKITGEVKVIEKEVIVEKTIEKTVEKKVIPFWVWIIVALALIPLILWLAGVFKSEPVIVEKEVEKIVMQIDTVYIQEIEQIEAKFNTVQFEVNKFDIPEDAKYALYDLAKLMEKNPKLKLSIEGHTSDEGDVGNNQVLSENRAKAVVDFLIARGVEDSRLTYKGLGSSKPKDSSNRDVNRRTEFVIIEQ